MCFAILQITLADINEEVAKTADAARSCAKLAFSKVAGRFMRKSMSKLLRSQTIKASRTAIRAVELANFIKSLEPSDRVGAISQDNTLKACDLVREIILDLNFQMGDYKAARLGEEASSFLDVLKDLQNALVVLYQVETSYNVQTPSEIERELDKIAA
jgi:hypothetical protein